jgi:multiple sugar transport system substrate-binding protein
MICSSIDPLHEYLEECQMKKSYSVMSILIVITFVLAACAQQTSEPIVETQIVIQEVVQTQVIERTVEVEVPVNVEVTSTPAPSKITGTIRVGSWDSGDGLIPFNAAIEKFEAKYPDVDVQLESVPADYGSKLLTQFAAGTAPDVFQVGDGQPGEWAELGALEPLDPYINGDNPLDFNVFYPAVAAIGQVEGETYLLTKDYSPLVLFYNKTLFDEAGVEYPQPDWTWEDLLTKAQELTKPDGSQWGIQLPNSWGDWLWVRGIMPLVYSNGGDFISEDGTTTTGILNSEANVETIQWYVDLFKTHNVAPTSEDVAALSGVDLFQTGRVAMLMTGRWPLSTYKADPNLNFGTMMLPMGEQHANAICWAGFAMYSGSQNKDTAWAFLKFIGAEEGAQEFAKLALTAVQPLAELQGLTNDPYNMYIMQDLQYIFPLSNSLFPKFDDCVEKFFKEELEKIFLEDKDVKEALDAAAEASDACLAQP